MFASVTACAPISVTRWITLTGCPKQVELRLAGSLLVRAGPTCATYTAMHRCVQHLWYPLHPAAFHALRCWVLEGPHGSDGHGREHWMLDAPRVALNMHVRHTPSMQQLTLLDACAQHQAWRLRLASAAAKQDAAVQALEDCMWPDSSSAPHATCAFVATYMRPVLRECICPMVRAPCVPAHEVLVSHQVTVSL